MSAREIVHHAVTTQGILASTVQVSNYRRVWARDSVITGIAGLIAKDEIIVKGLEASLRTLTHQQSQEGHIPSNVQFAGNRQLEKVSFGGLCGRVDANTWWLIGLGLLSQFQGKNYLLEYKPQVEKCLKLLQAWEFNNRGFLYVPQSGNWADEYILAGYTLYDQLLYYWALRLVGSYLKDEKYVAKSHTLKTMIQDNFWIVEKGQHELYHPNAYFRELKSEPSRYWEACINPGGYIRKFDLLGNALAILLGFSDLEQSNQVLEYGMRTTVFQNTQMFPSFNPVIEENDPEWFLLANNYAYKFRNYPYEFQNAGIWPAFNAWFGAAMLKAGKKSEAEALLIKIKQANSKRGNGFYECLNGKTGEAHGTKLCTWSAAGEILLEALLASQNFSVFKNGE